MVVVRLRDHFTATRAYCKSVHPLDQLTRKFESSDPPKLHIFFKETPIAHNINSVLEQSVHPLDQLTRKFDSSDPPKLHIFSKDTPIARINSVLEQSVHPLDQLTRKFDSSDNGKGFGYTFFDARRHQKLASKTEYSIYLAYNFISKHSVL
jgi:hypothetical protein